MLQHIQRLMSFYTDPTKKQIGMISSSSCAKNIAKPSGKRLSCSSIDTPDRALLQLNYWTRTIDHIKKEHILKSLPLWIQELLGKEVESMTAAQVSEKADSYLDCQENLLERHSSGINAIDSSSHTPSLSSSSSSSITGAFSDYTDDDNVNHIRRGAASAGNRNSRSESCPPYSKGQQNGNQPRSSSTGSLGMLHMCVETVAAINTSSKSWETTRGPTVSERRGQSQKQQK